jgi:hypothetical protein
MQRRERHIKEKIRRFKQEAKLKAKAMRRELKRGKSLNPGEAKGHERMGEVLS